MREKPKLGPAVVFTDSILEADRKAVAEAAAYSTPNMRAVENNFA